ncbi:MAG: guanine nucleotide-binding protein subunit gamma [Candidatus Magnetoovum sp. WYHC-5]|nr:guanine nucleotide-binding protein subunit gamma [Candidatus Magnetoovum sp. WYHC-5]
MTNMEIIQKIRTMSEERRNNVFTRILENAHKLDDFFKNKSVSIEKAKVASQKTTDEILSMVQKNLYNLQAENDSLRGELKKLKQQVDSVDKLKREIVTLNNELSRERAKMAEVIKEKAENDKKLEKMQLYWEKHVARQ